MPRMTINGGVRLQGEVDVSGAKNAILPIMAATLLLEGETTLCNIPPLADVNIMLRMLNALGVRSEYLDDTITVRAQGKLRHIAPYDLVTAMRASFFVAGPVLARTGYAKVPLPGGCSIGERPVDLHLKGFKELGASIVMEHGFVQISASKLRGARMRLAFPSVGATENLMMAACLAQGESLIENAAREPEIEDLARFINEAGGHVEGAGTSTISIQGVDQLNGISSYDVIGDRIEAGTLVIAGAMTQGDVTVRRVVWQHLEPMLTLLEASGCVIERGDTFVRVQSFDRPKAVDFKTEPYPGFPTDMQAQMMAYLTLAKGKSVIEEAIFENRFMHVRELMRMGARIKVHDHCAIVEGVESLSGAEVRITDLRAGAALILAGMVAQGYTTVHGMKHLHRGYYHLPEKLTALGATFER